MAYPKLKLLINPPGIIQFFGLRGGGGLEWGGHNIFVLHCIPGEEGWGWVGGDWGGYVLHVLYCIASASCSGEDVSNKA